MGRFEAVCPAADPALGLIEDIPGVRVDPCPAAAIPESSGPVVVSETGEGRGLAVLDTVRERDHVRPVIVLTDSYVPATASEAIRRGASDYLALDAFRDPADALRERLDRMRINGGPELGASAFRALAENVGDAILTVDTDDRVVFANDGIEALTGYSPDELVGSSLLKLAPERLHAAHRRGVERYLETGERALDWNYIELPFSHRAGHEITVALSFGEFERDGRRYFTGVIRDITDRMERERLLSDLLDVSSALMDARSRQEVAERVAEAAAETLEFEINAVHLYKEGTDRLVPAAVAERTRELMGEPPAFVVGEGIVGGAFAAGRGRTYDDVRDADDFEYGPVRSAMVLPLGERGTLSVGSLDPGGFDGTDRQVAELLTASARSALERLDRERELRRYGAVLETVQEMVYVLDTEGRCTMATQPLADRLGYEREAMIGRSADEILDGAAIEQGRRTITRLLANPDSASESYETTARTTDGECFPIEVEISLLEDDGFVGTVGVIRDISEIERTRKELGDERKRFTYLFETLPDPVDEVVFEDGEPIVRGINPAFERTFGYEESELAGSPLPEAFSMSPIPEETVEHTMATTVGTRQFLFRRVPYSLDGDTHAFGIYTDITQMKERERQLKVLHRVLRHNLRNGLNVVMAAANQLVDAESRADRRALAGTLEERAHSLVALSENAAAIERTIARPDDAERIDAVPLVESALERYRDELAVEAELPEALSIVADHRLSLVLLNLLENVREHCSMAEEHPSVRVALERFGDVAELRVEDDGPGIPDFERELVDGTREITQLEHGTGLGLWLVKWTVESYGGRVVFEEGSGTTVLVRLPLVDDRSSEPSIRRR